MSSDTSSKISKLCLISFLLALSIPFFSFIPVFNYEVVIARSVYIVLVAFTAIILGHLGRRQVRNAPQHFSGLGYGLIGLIVGYLIILLVVCVITLGWLVFSEFGSSLDDGSLARTAGQSSSQLLLSDRSTVNLSSGEVILFPADEGCMFQYSYLDWQHEFPGFKKIALSGQEAGELLEALQSGSISLIPRVPSKTQNGTEQSERKAFLEEFNRLRWSSSGCVFRGGVTFESDHQEFTFLSFKISDSGKTIFNSVHSGGRAGGQSKSDVKGISDSASVLLRTYLQQTQVGEIGVLYSELSAQEAVAKARSKFGDIYCRALRYIATTPEVIAAVGEPEELRPARGNSHAFAWMDYSASFLVRVKGSKGQAVVRVAIINAQRTLEFIHNGRMEEVAQRYFDWNGPDQKAIGTVCWFEK